MGPPVRPPAYLKCCRGLRPRTPTRSRLREASARSRRSRLRRRRRTLALARSRRAWWYSRKFRRVLRTQTPGTMTRIAHYRILEKIGEGAMGAVFVAEDTRLERRVALKVLLSENPDASRLKRFEREAKAIAALNHPNILSIYDFGREGEHPYIAMELLDGRTLRVVLDDGK